MAPRADPDIERMARAFHALGDETGLRILACLSGGEQCVCDLTDELEAGQSRLSFHLKTLKDAGLLRARREGRWVYYAISPDAVEEVRRFVGWLKRSGRSGSVRANLA